MHTIYIVIYGQDTTRKKSTTHNINKEQKVTVSISVVNIRVLMFGALYTSAIYVIYTPRHKISQLKTTHNNKRNNENNYTFPRMRKDITVNHYYYLIL